MAGSIKKRGNGWQIRYDLPPDPVTGARRQKSETVHGTKKDAERLLRERLREIETGQYAVRSSVTLAQYLTQWLETHSTQNIRATTTESYQSLLRLHVIPALGHLQLRDLVPAHFEKLYTTLLREGRKNGRGGLSLRTVQYIHALLRQALDHAVEVSHLISTSPVTKRIRPKKKDAWARKIMALTREEVNRFLAANRADRFCNLYEVVIGTGLRRGEALGLRWRDVDWDSKVIHVTQEVIRVKGGLRTQGLKTEASRRTIPVDDVVLTALKRQRAAQAEEKLRAGSAYKDEGLIFATELGGKFDPDRLVSRYFKPALKRAGLPPMRFHDLRHTHASLLLAAGVDIKTISERLGHTSVAFTIKTYVHLDPKAHKDAVVRLRRYLSKEEGQEQPATAPGLDDGCSVNNS